MVATRQEAEWWLRAGERDLSSAVGLHRLSIFEATAFHCQQAAEKLLKGLALARGATWQRTHSCVRLVRTLVRAGIEVPPEVATACRRLYDEVIADLALTDCRLVQGFVEANLHG